MTTSPEDRKREDEITRKIKIGRSDWLDDQDALLLRRLLIAERSRAQAAESLASERQGEIDSLTTALRALKFRLLSEATMKQWDNWRLTIGALPGASLPRDLFEAWLSDMAESIDAALAGGETTGILPATVRTDLQHAVDLLANVERTASSAIRGAYLAVQQALARLDSSLSKTSTEEAPP